MVRSLLLVSLVFVLASCKNGDTEEEPQALAGMIDTLKHSEKFAGVFAGTIPCADCPGIYSILEFSPDNNFYEHLQYLERGVAERSGKWHLRDSIITVAFSDAGSDESYFRIVN